VPSPLDPRNADSLTLLPPLGCLQHEANLRNHLKAAGMDSTRDLEDICKDSKVRDMVFKELLESGKKGGLKGPETLQAIILDEGPWTSDNGCLTAAQKLNRHAVKKKYESEIKVRPRGGLVQ
jgi:long-chain acyl-CoA synthetase